MTKLALNPNANLRLLALALLDNQPFTRANVDSAMQQVRDIWELSTEQQTAMKLAFAWVE